MKKFVLLLSSLCYGQTYPTIPANTNIGDLHCGIRLVAAQRVQTWCYSGSGVSDLRHNDIATIGVADVKMVGYVHGSDQILWIISRFPGEGGIDPGLTEVQIRTSTGTLTRITLEDLNPTTTSSCLYFCCTITDSSVFQQMIGQMCSR